MSVAPGGIGYLPIRCRQSARLMPALATLTRTSPAAGFGTGRVPGTSDSGPPGCGISIAVIVSGMLMGATFLFRFEAVQTGRKL